MSREIFITKCGFRGIYAIIVLISFGGCAPISHDADTFRPLQMAEFLGADNCKPALVIDNASIASAWKKVFHPVRHQKYGATFHVNIDFDRQIIKLRPVRDQQEAFLFYDPFQSGRLGLEINSQYTQSRCVCGGNRFELCAGFIYFRETTPDNFSLLLLYGRCTLCSEERLLFQNS